MATFYVWLHGSDVKIPAASPPCEDELIELCGPLGGGALSIAPRPSVQCLRFSRNRKS